jgi:hypothetical protein
MGLGNRSENSDGLYEFEFYGASAWLTFGVLCVSWYELCIDLLVENTIRTFVSGLNSGVFLT